MDRATILEGNGAFIATGRHESLAMMPRRRVMIIGCADPRVDPEKVLGLQMGDAAVIRNIGGRVTGPTLAMVAGLRSLGANAALAASQSGTGPGMDLVVLHHTDCGILHLADEPESLARFLEPISPTWATCTCKTPTSPLPMTSRSCWGFRCRG